MRRTFAILFVLVAFVAPTAAVPSEGTAAAVFAHEDWQAVLSRFVDDRGGVDYAGLSRDRATLDRYLTAIAENGPRSTPGRFPDRDHELAFYINAYNACVFAGVLERGAEVDTVWSGMLDGYRFFMAKKYLVDGQRINLRNLENKIVRARYGDARIHAALNCASNGCPRLPSAAFQGDTLDTTLNEAMAEFVTEERNVRIDHASRTVYLSKIFDWFTADFLADEREAGNPDPVLIDYVNRFRGDATPVPRDYKIRILDYDRSLNRARPGRAN